MMQQNVQQHATKLLHKNLVMQQSTLCHRYYYKIKSLLKEMGYNNHFLTIIDPEMDKKLLSGDYDKEQYLLFCKEYYKQISLSMIESEANLYFRLNRREALISLLNKVNKTIKRKNKKANL